MPDLEVIAVENASEDDSLAIIEAVAASEPRLVVVRNERNMGAAASRNRAIRWSRAEWVAFLDADDWWAPERLERMLAAAEAADVVSDDLCVVRVADPGSADASEGHSFLRHIGLTINAPCEVSLVEFVRRDLGLLHPLVRRAFLAQHGLAYDERFTIVHDFPLWASILALGARWIQLPEAYYFYSRSPHSLSTRQGRMIQDVIDSTDALLQEPDLRSDPEVVDALLRRKREWEGHAAFATVADRVRGRDLAGVARLFRRHPAYLPLILRRQLRHVGLRLARRARNPLRPSPARLL
jgi:succinoglycan biosynthesis protein ExoO